MELASADATAVADSCAESASAKLQLQSSFAREVVFHGNSSERAGPHSYQERFKWRTFGWNQLTARAKDRLVRNMRILQDASHCTGFCDQENIIYEIKEEINEHISDPIPHRPAAHASEKCDTRLQFLLNLDEQVRPAHIHMSVADRYPKDLRDEIARLTPKGNCSAEEKAKLFDEMKMELRQFYEDCPGPRFAPCLCHPETNV